MLLQMERSAIQLMAKRGKSVRQIAEEFGHSPTTIAKVLKEPVDRKPRGRRRASKVDPYRDEIIEWIGQGLPVVRMLEKAREDPDKPYTGSRSHFGEIVRRIKLEKQQQGASEDVPVRFEGMAAEYLQVDWGEVRRFPFTQAPHTTRYFLACRLKYSRFVWVRWTDNMKQETLFRGLVDCLVDLGFVPWVLVFDNMTTVTSGRDSSGNPIWTPSLLQLSAEFGFYPQACDLRAGNQKGSVESLVKWVKSNLLPGRSFADDEDLKIQTSQWLERVNTRPSQATGVAPVERLVEEVGSGDPLPATATDYGLLETGRVSPESTVAVRGNRYSVPVEHVGAPVVVRLHRNRVRIWRDSELLADHPRSPDGARERVIVPVTRFVPVLGKKPKARAMLYRDYLLSLGGTAPAFLSRLSYHHRADLKDELITVYALYERYGREELLAAMALADDAGTGERRCPHCDIGSAG